MGMEKTLMLVGMEKTLMMTVSSTPSSCCLAASLQKMILWLLIPEHHLMDKRIICCPI